MADPIDNIPKITPRSTGRVTPASTSPDVKRQREEEADFSFEDKVDISPAEHMHNETNEIDLSLAMVRALLNGELPQEAVDALSAFAPLGDLENAEAHCTRIEQKGQEFVTWPHDITLTQALINAAS